MGRSSQRAYKSARSVSERGPHFEKLKGNSNRPFKIPATVSHTKDKPTDPPAQWLRISRNSP
nr:MAG TPA: hypothetical protein [Caudoviricetes sp.]